MISKSFHKLSFLIHELNNWLDTVHLESFAAWAEKKPTYLVLTS